MHVETATNGGNDSLTCGPLADPCQTVRQATINAPTNSNILIGDGTFTLQDSSDPTKYYAINPGAKSLQYIGNGIDKTEITGEDIDNSLGGGGIFRFATQGQAMVVKDLKLSHFPRTSPSGAARFAITINPSGTGLARAVDVTIDKVDFAASSVASPPFQQAINVNTNAGKLDITNSTFNSTPGSNTIQFDAQMGETNITGNMLTQTLSTTPVIYDWMHGQGANTWNQIGKHTISNNIIKAPGGIAVGTFSGGVATAATMSEGVTIENNMITTAGSGRAIQVANQFNATGQIDLVKINNNTITGSPNSTGISLTGGIPDAEITGNNVRDIGFGVALTRQGPAPGEFPENAKVQLNQLVGNTTGLFTTTGAAINADATNNWWGCNDGPGQPGCDIITPTPSSVDADPWAVLTATGQTATLPPAGSNIVTAGITENSDGAPITPLLPDGSTIGFSATGGGVFPSSATTTGSQVTTTFLSNAATGRSATATYDNGSAVVTWAEDTTPPVVTITAPVNGSTTSVASAALTYTVFDADDPNPVCSSVIGKVFPLVVGLNTFTVSCTDASGNVGTATTTVTYIPPDVTPPAITILTPANGSTTANNSAVLTYSVSDAGDPNAVCSPPSGTTLPLAEGANTLTVTCTDASGNSSVASVMVTYIPNYEPLPACARDVAITNVARRGSQTRITGFARLKYAGKKLRIEYQPTGKKTVASPKVRSDGSWSVLVHRPSKPSYKSNSARYRALISNQKTIWVKVTRRMGTTSVTSIGGGKLTVRGNASKPLLRGQRVRVMRSDACGKYRQVATLKVNSKGKFSGDVSQGGAAPREAVSIRLILKVAKSSNPRKGYNTYSIVQPVLLLGD